MPGKLDTAQSIADKGQLRHEIIAASPFALTSFHKLSKPNAPLHIYIEGDGQAWLSRTQPALDPTPSDPLALKLAALDPAPNIVYLARPCQYSGLLNQAPCPSQYWRSARYAPEVLQSYNRALDTFKARAGASEIDLIGFSGGAAVAALLAGQRNDVASLRSVAGNLDHRAHSAYHNVSLLSGSLNPPDYAAQLAHIPQHHFIGGQDKIVPRQIYDRYSAALPQRNCTSYQIIPEAAHMEGWTHNWPALLAQPVSCQ